MEQIANELLEELNCDTAFTIPIFGGIEVAESVVITWVIMAFMLILAICMTRNLKVQNPGKRQVILETAVCGLQNMVKASSEKKAPDMYLIWLRLSYTLVYQTSLDCLV